MRDTPWARRVYPARLGTASRVVTAARKLCLMSASRKTDTTARASSPSLRSGMDCAPPSPLPLSPAGRGVGVRGGAADPSGEHGAMNPFRSSADRQPPLSKSRRFSKAPASQPRRGQRLELEALEDRFLPAGAIISGFVFNDLNNNGLMETGEPPIANSTIELRNAQNVVVGTATTDANGHYQFDHDATVSTAVQTITKTFTIPATATNFSLAGAIDKFDPALGNLIEVDVVNAGAITSDIRVENTSTSSPSTIQATVAGHLTLTGPGGLTVETDLSQNAGSFGASIYDGHLDFGGTSGKD